MLFINKLRIKSITINASIAGDLNLKLITVSFPGATAPLRLSQVK